MNTFAVLFFGIQICLIQNVFSQCLGKYSTTGPGLNYPAAVGGYPGIPDFGYSGYGGYDLGGYGGTGEGNVVVAGELPVAGNTAVSGQVPIMGAVNFGGAVPAAGVVTISGNCACGCGSPYLY